MEGIDQDRFRDDLMRLLNRYGIDSRLEVADWLLADYLIDIMESLDVLRKRKAAFTQTSAPQPGDAPCSCEGYGCPDCQQTPERDKLVLLLRL
jgi:hypothetical protein